MAVIDHNLLFSTDLKYFKELQVIGGRKIFERYPGASSILNGFEDRYKHFLAFPEQDRDSDVIKFYGYKWSQDLPKVLADLEGSENDKYQIIKQQTLEYYKTKIDELKSSGKDVAAFLSDAIKVVDDRFVYCYDNRVILGAWGMQVRENVREHISEIRKTAKFKDPSKPTVVPEDVESKEEEDLIIEPRPETVHKVTFNPGQHGSVLDHNTLSKNTDDEISDYEIPSVVPNQGYEFTGWDELPSGYKINGDKDFIAQYREIQPSVPPPIEIPWWRKLLNWFKNLFFGAGCLKWLWRLLLLLLLLALLFWILSWFDGCNHNVAGGGTALGDNDSTWVKDDPNVGKGRGIYDPNDPYTPQPTPPGYEDILPPQQGVLPPMEGEPDIIPGNPAIIANRLNILMEDENKSILDLARAFKTKYPDDKYKVVYYDDVVKRMQIEIPKEEREKLKQEIPPAFAPDYQLFIFDESMFEGVGLPTDIGFSDNSKAWYFNAIRAPQAWDITRGSEKITIAIIDNGFNLSHPELKSKVIQPYNVWKHNQEIHPQSVDHGTHVAGIALALADNGIGLCGIAPNCKFMPIQVANENEIMTTTSVLDGILYALYQGADVINISLGGMFKGLEQYGEEYQRDLIQNHFIEEERLWRHIMKIAFQHNSTLVVAVGNDNVLAGIDAIQRPESFIAVSAVDKNNQPYKKAEFSNYGTYSDISAPGVGIYSSVGKDGFQYMDGTSMAAPIISGTVALMKSINPGLSNKDILCILQGSGIQTQGNIGNFVQVDKALQLVKSGQMPECTPQPSTGDVQVLLNWGTYNDLDLMVTDPSGESVWYKNRTVSSGGQLEIDMNVQYPGSTNPIENIYWPTGAAPAGTYNVYLVYYKKHIDILDNPYRIEVKYGDKVEKFSGSIKTEKDVVHICTFNLQNGNTSVTPPSNNSDRRGQLEQEKRRLQEELERINKELLQIENQTDVLK
jgi:subtilisin family serine protease